MKTSTLEADGRLSRRAFVGGLAGLGASAAGAVLVSGCGSWAQRVSHVPRIGFVYASPLDARAATRVDAFRAGLHDHGYNEDQNIHIEWRFSTSQTGDDIPSLVAELVALPVDVLATATTPPTQAAKKATRTIPIIGIYVGDPVATGLVDSLARPGGNVTAVSAFNPELSSKRLEFLRELLPALTHIGFVYNQGNPANVVNLNELQQAAGPVGIVVHPIGLRTLEDLEPGIEQAVRGGVDAIAMVATGSIPPSDVYIRSSELALRRRLPSIGPDRALPESGGLISAGVDVLSVYRRAGYYVDRVLKGARPLDLPVEQPTAFEVVLNRTTAQALGLTIPPAVAAQITEWVE
jgi:putative ABC transport system substrate-binding protein